MHWSSGPAGPQATYLVDLDRRRTRVLQTGDMGYVAPHHATPDTAGLTLAPPDGRNAPRWGKVLLANVAQRQVHLLAEPGQLAAVLPDGSLLLRRGWVNGELQHLAPAYDKAVAVAPGGPWTWGWAVSPEGRRVAWLEMTPPPGDWSERLPAGCCSGDSPPVVSAVAVWDRTTGRTAVLAAGLPGGEWRVDSAGRPAALQVRRAAPE